MAYERDLDLNLLRVFLAVADTGSATEAASALYVTQPAVSAALKRLRDAVGADLVVREGRGLALTDRGRRLAADVRPHLEAVWASTRAAAAFDPATVERTIRLGLADSAEGWLLPPLLDALAAEAPGVRIVVLPVQFRTVPRALEAAEVDLAVAVADELGAGVLREPLFGGGFFVVYDPEHGCLDGLTQERYLALDHVIVSYNGDLRGIIEDMYGVRRRVRLSLPTFHSVGRVVQGRALVATLPALVAQLVLDVHPGLRAVPSPYELGGSTVDLLWRRAIDDDAAVAFVRGHISRIARRAAARGGVGSGRPTG